MYDAGQGIEKNSEQAIEYMTEAASRGSDEAKKYLQERNLPIPSPKLGSNANE
jgi:TPR repeat protein